MREAVTDLWGDAGLEAVGRALPPDVRRLTVDLPVVPDEWLPAMSAMAWFVAVWETCANRQTKDFSAFIDRQTELGFGRVRKFFLSYATPKLVVSRAAALWRDDNTAGELVALPDGPYGGIAELRNHIYATTPLSRLAITELIRSILSRCRAKDVTGRSVLLPDGTLRMHFAWSTGTRADRGGSD